MSLDFDLLKALSETPGVPSREDAIREVIIGALRPLVDEVHVDAIGNAIGVRHPRGHVSTAKPVRVVVAAHMDEIGFLVRHVDSKGFLRLHPVGGFDARNLVAQRVEVHTRNGERLHGLLMPQGKPIHLMRGEEPKAPKVDDLFVDLGLSGDEVGAKVEVGDMVTLSRSFAHIGNHVSGKALDDRACVFVILEALRALGDHAAEVVVVATVQEEVGLRGAQAIAHDWHPDIAIALDVTLAVDIPGGSEEHQVTAIGKGVAIKVADGSSLSDHRLVRWSRDLATRHEIPYQLEILPAGGTDAGMLQRVHGSRPTITYSVPVRYVHTVNELASVSDLHAAVSLLTRALEAAHEFAAK
jgi:putative aminopeptidase FrvX